jgi:hypothetical protein
VSEETSKPYLVSWEKFFKFECKKRPGGKGPTLRDLAKLAKKTKDLEGGKSENTIKRKLDVLLDQGKITVLGSGRSRTWWWVEEKKKEEQSPKSARTGAS